LSSFVHEIPGGNEGLDLALDWEVHSRITYQNGTESTHLLPIETLTHNEMDYNIDVRSSNLAAM
jgi:hypothetical protein